MTIRLDGDFGISASGNVTGNYIIGDGSLLTNVGTGSSYGNANVTALLSDGTFAGNIVPAGNVTQSLGNATNQWLDLWISNATIYLNSIPLGVGNTGVLQFAGNDIVTSGPNVVNTGNVETSGDVVGGNVVIATGGALTFADGSVQASAYANANVEAYLPTSTTIISINTNVANTDSNVANTDTNVANLTATAANTDANVANLVTVTNNTDSNVANLVTVTTNTDSNVANLVTVTTNTDSNVANLTATVTNTDANVANLVTVTTNTDSNVANVNANVANLTITVSSQGNAIGNLEANAYANANVESLLSSGSITTPIVLSGLNGNVSARNLFVGDSIYAPGQVTQVNFGADYVNYFTFSQYGRVSTNVPFDTTGNIAAGGNISAVGNVIAPFFIGNVFGANVVGEVAVANTVSNPLQPNITALGTITSLTANAVTINGQLTANGNAQFNQDVYFAGNVTLPGNINQISGNSGSFFGNAVTGFGALYAGLPAGYTLLNQEVMQYAANFNGYTQVTMRNISGGDRATGDFVVTADNGTDTTNYINMGISGSGYNGLLANNSLGTSLYANDGYLYAQGNGSVGGNLVLGSNQTNGVVRIIANGASNIGDVVATFASTGLAVNGNVSAESLVINQSIVGSGASPAPTLSGFSSIATVGTQGNISASGNLTAAGYVSATGNVTANYLFGNGSQLSGLDSSNAIISINSSIANTDSNVTNLVTVTSNTDANVANLVTVLGNTDANVANNTSNITTLQGQVYGNANVAANLAAFGSNPVSTTGNITVGYVIGNGSLLTDLPAPTVTQDITTVGDMSIMTYDGNIKYVNNTTIEPASGNIKTAGNISAVGNVTGAYIVGNGSQLTNLPISPANAIVNGNSNVFISTGGGSITAAVGGLGVMILGQTSVALGFRAGQTPVAGTDSQIAIGREAGRFTQGLDTIAIGTRTGRTGQLQGATAIGGGAGGLNQGIYATALGGFSTGFNNQGQEAIAIGGVYAGEQSQGNNAIAIGSYAGNFEQGANAIAIGSYAGRTSQPANSIIINASSLDLEGTNSGLYIAPVRNDTGNVTNVVYYNTDTKEVTYGPVSGPSVDSIITAASIAPAATNTQYNVTALAESATIAAPTGSPADGAKLTIRILDNGTAQTLTWNAIYQVIGTTLPTTTVSGKTLYVGCIYNESELTWDVVSVAQQL